MPSVGLRRTTRVFGVIKGVDGARVLRSGRRLWQESGDGKLRRSNDGVEWYHTIIKNDNYQTKNQNKNSDLKYKENSGWAHDDKLKKDLGVVIAIAAPKRIKRVKSEKKFGIVYRRKRKRLGGEKSEDSEDKKFGIQFSRRQRRSLDDESSESLVCTPELVVLVEDFSSSSSNGLSCFLSSVLRYIKRVNLSLSELADFLLSEPISSVFASNGLHFARDLSADRIGICKFFGTRQLLPMFSVDFSSIPSCFVHMHLSLFVRFKFLSPIPVNNSLDEDDEDDDVMMSGSKVDQSCTTMKTDFALKITAVPEIDNSGSKAVVHPSVRASKLAGRSTQYRNGLNSRGIQKRRSSLRRGRPRNSAIAGLHKASGALVSDLISSRRKGIPFSSVVSKNKLRRSVRSSPAANIKEMNSAAVGVKKDMNMSSCSANILVSESDRCYRIEGATVMFEFTGSREWVLVVKKDGLTRYTHLAQKSMRTCASNRFTHDIIWTGDDNWKLEFPNRQDWFIFKELYKECSDCNVPASVSKVISVPGVREVLGYENGGGAPFLRPYAYISSKNDEVARALARSTASYDMDSEDEEWLKKYNNDFLAESDHLSEDNFELLIDALEKSYYCNPDDFTDENAAAKNALQSIIEIITQDIMFHGHEILERAHLNTSSDQSSMKEQRFGKINLSLTNNNYWREKVLRLHLLLTTKESAINVPSNLDARRRITFFANSLFMNMPKAPKVRDMFSFSVLTPYYKEDVLYSDDELHKENEDGITILFYLKTIYRDEWKNFEERINDQKLMWSPKEKMEFTRQWVSYRGQTLARTVRGMMYYRQALELQCLLEFAGDDALLNGFRTLEPETDQKAYFDQAQALADLKFTYVVSCQVYGAQKKSTEQRDRSCYSNILNLMLANPSLRVAYIDERETTVNGKSQKLYYSVLVKGGDKYDEEIYRIKLPGPPTDIGEGKPENQNHAIIFTRGEALQTIDMNQDNYFEEAFKMRNVLEELKKSHRRKQNPTILGIREHIFTGSVSSLAWFMSNQETSFVTIGQRILASPLRVRFHYGHPDIFDRIFHITRGGISKASKIINLSEDIFAGYNTTLRGGYVTHHEYIQVGKGRDVGMNQISSFEAKVANGNGEQTLSRDVYRLGRRFDFYRMLSFYFTTVGFYFSSMITVLTVYVFLYGRLYMVMSGLEREILMDPSINESKALEQALAPQSIFQLGLLLVFPMVMEIGLEKGFRTALGDFVIMQLQLASVFFTFQLGTKAHYYGRTILHGGSKYRATGRGFVVFHAKFAENYRLYSRSHFVKGLELFILLVVYEVYGKSYRSSSLYLFVTLSMWLLVGSWLFAPFVFNPSGFDWQKTVDDWTDWKRWMGNRGGIGIAPDKSWESWWGGEQEHLKHTNIRGWLLEIILAFRFFIYQYGIVYHLDIAHHSKSLLVYGLSWIVMLTTLLLLKMVSMGRRKFRTDFQLMFRILKALLFLGFVSVMTVLFVVCGLTIQDLFAGILAFMPTGWALLLIGQACRSLFMWIGFWDSIKELARAYEYIMGLLLFMPIAILSWFPFVSEFQTRLLFNQAFSRGLQISMILAGKKEGADAGKKEGAVKKEGADAGKKDAS